VISLIGPTVLFTSWYTTRHGKDVDVVVLGCNAVWACRKIKTFLRNILLSSLTLKMEALCSSETLVSTYKSTRSYNPEQQHRQVITLKSGLVCKIQLYLYGEKTRHFNFFNLLHFGNSESYKMPYPVCRKFQEL
jgi:hypothetical protein